MMTSEDDSRLVRECLEGNTRAFEVLVDRYYSVLFNVAYRMVGHAEDAKDIVQTTFLKAYEKLGTYDPQYRVFSWIYRIMLNESLNLRARRKPQVQVSEALLSPSRTPEEEEERRQLGATVQAALQQLPEEQRQVLVLRHFADLSYREMSWVLEIPEKKVKSRLYSARQQMGAILLRRGVQA